ncbi:hypothetical protein [Mycobacteroides abscessus]|uniref:Uncharacterized protein n=1 Tax=Mycobacteroides abscessus TaxID=36809 RepID=A0ABD7HQ74_9MYCO|nr:hypothetical protein [Mycobacteroides abscessus]AWG62986.1 hypothetical protein DDT46_03650 [Mycobacteroides abscessus]PVA29585.1 hypothetical protein DDJ88_14090 [Mycobacteroides abscessus]PVA43492.1 hypothetical protein DDJ35_22920 [Mycobacteroides abscessus]PVA73554.1 hypothetical protein DDJ37_14095 [Mycobacteroides abscessus]PVB12105.1 hypothetical protein DDJ40_17295 [Mycobacteroides abscessus]
MPAWVDEGAVEPPLLAGPLDSVPASEEAEGVDGLPVPRAPTDVRGLVDVPLEPLAPLEASELPAAVPVWFADAEPLDADEPSDDGCAKATAHPVKNAAPTPSATASPPTRPT